jgi:hypothetical protein
MGYRRTYYILIALRFVLLAAFVYLFVATGHLAYLIVALVLMSGVVLSAVLKVKRMRLARTQRRVGAARSAAGTDSGSISGD